MSIPSKFWTAVDGVLPAGLITAERLNKNWDELYKMFDPAQVGIDSDNIKSPSTILIATRNYTGASKITGDFEFDAFPTVPDASVPDAKLSANVPLKNAAGTFSAKQTFTAKIDLSQTEIEQPVMHKLASAPGSPVLGQTYFNTTVNHPYIWTGSEWVQMDYIGAYTGGAVTRVSDFGTVDDGDSYKLWFKTEGASPVVKIAIKGEPFPKRFYTELGYHDHVFSSASHTHTVIDDDHKHWVGFGKHGHGTTQYSLGTHTHGVSGATSQIGVTGGPTMHAHTYSATTDASGSKQAIGDSPNIEGWSNMAPSGISLQTTLVLGSVLATGVNAGTLSAVQKLYAKSLTVKIDTTNVTANILSATGWSVIGDGFGTHAFHTAGTGEMTASGWLSYTAGFHVLEIIEPESGYGCNFMIHIEVS